uniref:Uncharacterized protein n=1 Tax=Panagrolaimus sp. PS1159 TaxID=55785 RepID=A0AC35G409_9BILA
MATKNCLLFVERKSFGSAISDELDRNKKFSNFNLNKTSEFSKASDFQTDCKKSSNKHFDPSASLNSEEKGKKSGFDSKLLNFGTNFDESEIEKCWKKNDSTNTTNNSTLSLHIFAFENSNVASPDSFNESFQKSWLIQKQKQINPALTFISKNPFEFQRQQNDTVPEPEVTQFKASQRLLKSNKSDLNFNTAKSPYESNEKNEVNEILEHVEHLLVNDSNNDGSNNNLAEAEAEAEECVTFIESQYAYEYYEEKEMDEIVERVKRLSINDSTNVESNNEQQNFIGIASGDATNVKILQAQLVEIRIRPQYIEYLRAKHGWSSMCKFKTKIPQQYIQRTRTLLSTPLSIPPPQSSFDPMQQTSSQ